jgi:type I restriction enzyme R subunit
LSLSISSEAGVVQHPLTRYATEAGWTFLSAEDAVRLRRGETGLILHEVLIDQLQRLNPEFMDAAIAEDLAERLVRVPSTIQGNLQAWEHLKGLKTAFVPALKQERNVTCMDTEEVDRNTFQVTEEFQYTNGTETDRADVVFLVNGIPVIVVETKAATKVGGMSDAFDQLVRYHREIPELMSLVQVQGLTQVSHFLYGATWNLSAKNLYNWRDEQAGDFETLVKAFVHPARVVRVLSDFILFTRVDRELSKVVLRPHQMRAVDRAVQRAADPKKRRGLVWHTQGSGKTYTMITVAKSLIEDPAFQNPTVLMLVDRNELEAQLFGNLEAVGFGNVEVAQSKHHLRELLSSDRRGLIVSTIHKFDDIPADLNTGEHIYVLVDEAHRSTGGDLGNYLMGALANATYVGFTGTPIDRTAHGKGTFKVFGIDDPETRYLDKYSIRESIEDGTTVPLHYSLAPNDLQVDRDVLEREFLGLAELEGVSDVAELNRVLDKAVTLKNLLKNPDRMAKVAEFVARHFTEIVEPMGFKAFLVAPDREACARYKDLLDQHLPDNYSEVVMSTGYNDPPQLSRFGLSETDEQRIRKAFRKPKEVPRILIVTEKLLTGFDAPILYCMYLDKPMRDHVLLQAIARVNRPYEDDQQTKPAGFVLDFVGIFDNLERALAFDSADISGVIEDLDVLKRLFEEQMARARTEYITIGEGKAGDKAAEAILEQFRDPEKREEFYQFFREVEETYEILSPDPFLRSYVEDFGQLAAMFRLLRASYEPYLPLGKSFLRKTEALVQDLTETESVLDPEKVYTLGEDALKAIAESEQPPTVRVFNLLKVLEDLVRKKGPEQPHLIPIGDRAEQIVKAFEARQIETQQALEQLEALLKETEDAEAEQQASGLSPESFSVYWLLKREGVAGAKEIAQQMGEALARNPHWSTSEQQEREVRTALYKALIEEKANGIPDLVDWLLTVLKRRSS